MATVINGQRNGLKIREQSDILSGILPYKLYGELTTKDMFGRSTEEIRCRRGRRSFVTMGGKNIMLEHILTDSETEYMTERIFGGSLYAHKETLLEGYVTLSKGIRVGICGRAATDGGKIIGIYDISGINIRLPSYSVNVGNRICNLLHREKGGVLIYAPPGVGKTTLLRGVAARMSMGDAPKRVCVVDTRGELGVSLDGCDNSVDLLVGYPREKGIEIATRTMSAELIVCDEIGDPKECEAILSAQNSGIPLIASAHGSNLSTLLRRKGIRYLHEGHVFEYYVAISRRLGAFEFEYTVTEWEEANSLV
ncbi:MAG: hypothetical protein E7607_03740 [Ruminococcaceae bacterium]|nr:hypothetical protein [Oscillospiraceae bacterium]